MTKFDNGKKTAANRDSKRPRKGPSYGPHKKNKRTSAQSEEQIDADYAEWLAARGETDPDFKAKTSDHSEIKQSRPRNTRSEHRHQEARTPRSKTRSHNQSANENNAPRRPSRNSSYASNEETKERKFGKTEHHNSSRLHRKPSGSEGELSRKEFLAERRKKRSSKPRTSDTYSKERRNPKVYENTPEQKAPAKKPKIPKLPPPQKPPQPSPDGSVRLNKAIASAGVCSRRAADELILNGDVTVNGEVITTPGVKVFPAKDEVTAKGERLVFPGAEKDFTYIMLHKPLRAVTTVNDPEGRRTVYHLLPEEMKQERIFPVGRLDFLSEGLLILTDDGELTYRLTHPKWHLPKVYHVRIKGRVSQEALRIMQEGMTLEEGDKLAPVDVRVLPDERRSDTITLLEMTLIQGVNRQIRRMCRDLDLTVATLRRVAHGPVKLGNLERSHSRHLTKEEVIRLRKACGLEMIDGEFI